MPISPTRRVDWSIGSTNRLCMVGVGSLARSIRSIAEEEKRPTFPVRLRRPTALGEQKSHQMSIADEIHIRKTADYCGVRTSSK